MNQSKPLSGLFRAVGLASVCVSSVVAAAAGTFATSTAHADGRPSCTLALHSSVSALTSPNQLRVVKTHKLFRTEQKPYSIIPEGVALWVRAPAGVTAADLHQRLSACAKQADANSENNTPICVPGARISVDHHNGFYLVTVKSDSRKLAIEIQRRSERL